jgi:eukaryotic-like serine/threonine-protein kinase
MTDWVKCDCGSKHDRSSLASMPVPTCSSCGRVLMDGSLNSLQAQTLAYGKPAEHVLKVTLGSRVPIPNVPGYDIQRELGRGGMGVVYQAREVSLNRTVALKMILTGAQASEQERARFMKEAEAVASLQHPGIVQIFHIGDYEGLPFLSLEYVSGGSLAQRLNADNVMRPMDAAILIESLARTMQYAHEQGVIHRDLKPANILMGTAESTSSGNSSASPTPREVCKISDFGLAKKLDETIAVGGGTRTGAVLGTPSYIAPEQAGGKSSEVTARSDVYSLGAILYELLVGRPPFRADTPMETILQVLKDEPVPPSKLQPKLPRDLETICLTCLEKDPARRYTSALALAEDLGRFQRGEPILARPSSTIQRGWKWANRHPAVTAFGITACLATIGFILFLLQTNKQLGDLYTLAEDRAKTANEQKILADNLASQRMEILESLKEEAERNRRSLYALQLAQVANIVEQDPTRAEALLNDGAKCPPDLRDFTWNYLLRLCHREERIYDLHRRRVEHVTASPDGLLVATGDSGGIVRLWHPWTQVPVAILMASGGGIRGLKFTPDGTHVGTLTEDGTLQLWPIPAAYLEVVRKSVSWFGERQPEWTKSILPRMPLVTALQSSMTMKAFQRRGGGLDFSTDGRWLLAGGADAERKTGQLDGVTKLWDATKFYQPLTTGLLLGVTGPALERLTGSKAPEPVRQFFGHVQPITVVAMSPDQQWIATGSEDAGVMLHSLKPDSKPVSLRQHGGPIRGLAFSPDNTMLATTDNGESPVVVMWDLTRRRPTERRKLIGHTSPITAVAFSTDGRTVISAGSEKGDANVRVWDTFTGLQTARLSGHTDAINGVVGLPDGKSFVSASSDGTARVWQNTLRSADVATLNDEPTLRVVKAALSNAGDFMTWATSDGTIHTNMVRDTFNSGRATGRTPFTLEALEVAELVIHSLAISDDGQHIAAGTSHGLVVWDIRRVLAPINSQPPVVKAKWILTKTPVQAVRFTANGTQLVVVSGGTLRRYRAQDHQESTPGPYRDIQPADTAELLEVSPDGNHVVVVTGKELVLFNSTTRFVVSVADPVSLDVCWETNRLIVTQQDHKSRIWAINLENTTLTEEASLEMPCDTARFTQNGQTIVAVMGGHDIALIDPLTRQERAILLGHADRIVGLGMMAKDSGLVSFGRDGVARRWNAPRGRTQDSGPPTQRGGRPNRPAAPMRPFG